MNHSVSKARIRKCGPPDIICSLPNCKVEPYGLGRKNSLIAISYRLHCQTNNLECERSTTWVTTGMEIIGVETRHIKELDINSANFYKPEFKENAPFGMFKDKQIPLETSIKRRSQEIEENSTLKPSDIMNLSQPLDLLSNPIGRRSSNGSISDKLMTLMGSENVQEVNYSEIKCKLRRRRSTVVPYNRVVKLHKETSTSSQKIRKISSQSALRACNRPKPKLMATVMLKEKEDALNSGLIKTPLRESTFITNINDFTDKTLTWVNKTSRRPVCGRRESIVNRCPSIKTNLKGRSKTIIARKINRRAMAPLSYRMNRLFTLHDSSQAEIFCVVILQTYTAELLMQSASPEPITWPPNVIWYWYYYEDYILKKAKSLPAPRIGMRLEFNLDQLLSDNVEIHQTKFSFWRVFLKVFLLILISISLFVFGWLYGKSFIKWWMRLLQFYWKLLKLFWFSPLM